MVKIHEIAAFALSVIAFSYGAFRLFRKGTPKYFQLYVCAAGCYMLEELWVIVNSLLGNGSQDGLVTVRLFGFFGCLCFMLSANVNEFDKVVDEGNSKGARTLALLAPAVLAAAYACYAFSPLNTETALTVILGFAPILPALPAAYFSLKHLLLQKDEMGYLDIIKEIDIAALIFYAANYVYPLADLLCTKRIMSIYDLALGAMLLVVVILCGKGADKWKVLI